ncbi:MAG TPA: DMT family transporter [Patescibacteria group bacterium]|nr:DMT family transporter [Patescibacteria group bacterium]
MSAILMAVATYFGWGAGDAFGAIVTRKIGAYRTVLGVMVITLILFLPLIPSHIAELTAFTPLLLTITIVLGSVFLLGNLAINEALRRTHASLALTVFSSYSALIVILSVIFYHERLTIPQIISIATIFWGVYFCTYAPQGARTLTRSHRIGILWALLGMVSIAVFFTFIKPVVARVGWFWPIYLTSLWLPVVLWIVWKKKELNLPKNWKSAAFPLVACTMLLRGGDFFFNAAIDKGLSAVVAPIAGAYPTLSVILAYLVFREVPTKRQVLGIILALAGIVALALTQ